MQTNQNNLTELNNVLFETLRGVKDGTVDNAKAETITKVSNSIISNAKAQLQALKAVKGLKLKTDVFGGQDSEVLTIEETPQQTKPRKKDLFDLKAEYAQSLGFKTMGQALVSMTKTDFENGFDAWNSNQQ